MLHGRRREMPEREGKLHAKHRARMRKKFAEYGIDVFNSHELLEYLLYYVFPRGDTNEIAHRLEDEFGSLPEVMAASRGQLVSVRGIGENAALYIDFIHQLCEKYNELVSEAEVRKNGRFTDIKDYFISAFTGLDHEAVFAAALDRRGRFVRGTKLADGNIACVASPVRLIYDFSVRTGCDRIVIAHNHPGMSFIPSACDIHNTKDLVERLGLLGIDISDHIIVGKDGALSLRETMHSKDIWGNKENAQKK